MKLSVYIRLTAAGAILAASPCWSEEAVSALPEDEAAEVSVEAPAALAPNYGKWRGRARASYDYRDLGGYTDEDVYIYWTLRGTDLAERQLDVYTSGRVHQETDSSTPDLSEDPYVGAEDVSTEPEYRLLQLYGDIHNKDQTMVLRSGRQYIEVADSIHVDGFQLLMAEQKRLGGRFFIGKPVSFYTSVSGDLFVGGSLVSRPWSGHMTRLTYARYEDDSIEPDTPDRAADDHYFVDTRQRMGDSLRGRAYASVVNGDFRMGGADFHYSLPDRVFDVSVGGRYWGDYDAVTRVYSPLYSILGKPEPYKIVYGRVTTEILPWLFLAPGATLRMVDEADAQNRDYRHFDLSLIVDPKDSGWDASVSGEHWDVKDGDRFFGLSGEVRYRYKRIWEVSAGAAYLDYEYGIASDFSYASEAGDLVLSGSGTRVESSPDAYTYLLRCRWNLSENLVLRLDGEVEDSSTEEDLGYRIRSAIEVRL